MSRAIRACLGFSLLSLAFSVGCASAPPPPPAPPPLVEREEMPPPPPMPVEVRERPPAASAMPNVPFPRADQTKLSNGLEIVTVPHRGLPVVHLTLVIRAGNAHEPAALAGLADFTSDMLREGTATRTKRQIVEQIEFVGGSLSSSAGMDYSTVSASVLREHVDVALALLADVAQHPILPPKEVEKIRESALNQLKLNLADPGFLASRQMALDLYGKEHPYSRVTPSERSLLRIKREELIHFHRDYFRPNNAFLVVAGDIDAATITPKAERALGKWKAKPVPTLTLPRAPVQNKRTVSLIDRKDSVQSAIRLGNIALSRSDSDWVPFYVTNYLLGGSASARLFLILREKLGLTYGAYSRVGSRLGQGSFVASAASRNDVTDKALAAFVSQLRRIGRHLVPDQELINAKRYLTGNFALSLETASGVADLVVTQRFFNLGSGYWDRYRAELNAVTPAQVQAMAHKYIHPDTATMVIVGVAAQLEPILLKYGPVRIFDTRGALIRAAEMK